MKAGKQTTLRQQTAVSGIGVHSGLPATLTILPAEADTGIVFVRCGVGGQPDREVRANFRAVTATEFQTVLGDATGPLCSTAEHVLAALSGLGIDNAVIEIDGPEVPIMDGSAAPLHPDPEADPCRQRRGLRRAPAEYAGLPDRARHQLRSSADRPPGRGL